MNVYVFGNAIIRSELEARLARAGHALSISTEAADAILDFAVRLESKFPFETLHNGPKTGFEFGPKRGTPIYSLCYSSSATMTADEDRSDLGVEPRVIGFSLLPPVTRPMLLLCGAVF